MAVSIGWVTSVSTSSGDRPGHSVRMTTRGRSRSGNTSIGIVGRQVAAVDQHDERRGEDQRPVAKRQADDGVEHVRPCYLPSSSFLWRLPSAWMW